MSKGVQAVYIRGVEGSINPQPYFKLSQLTAGELYVSLVKEQFDIKREFYRGSQNVKNLDKAATILENALFAQGSSIHGLTGLPSGIFASDAEQLALKAVRNAQKLFKPSAGVMMKSAGAGIAGAWDDIVESCRPTETSGYDPEYGQYYNTTYEGNCEQTIYYSQTLNTKMVETAHHWMYEFMTKDNFKDLIPESAGRLATKQVLHQGAVDELKRITQIERVNLRLWSAASIMRQNVNNKLEPLTPEECINVMWQDQSINLGNYKTAKIGSIVLTAAILIKLCICFVAAIVAVSGLIQVCKGKEPTAFGYLASLGIGSPSFSSDTTDFQRNSQNNNLPIDTGTGINPLNCTAGTRYDALLKQCVADVERENNGQLPDWAIPVAAGLAALFLLRK